LLFDQKVVRLLLLTQFVAKCHICKGVLQVEDALLTKRAIRWAVMKAVFKTVSFPFVWPTMHLFTAVTAVVGILRAIVSR